MSLILGPGDQGQAELPADLIKEGSEATFMEDVAQSDLPVVVYFTAPWCGPCKTLGPAVEKVVKAAAGKVRMVKINVDDNKGLAAQLQIQSVPTVYGFVDGRPVDAFQGAVPDSKIKQFVEKLVGEEVNSPIDQALAQAKEELDRGDANMALQIYMQVLGADKANTEACGGVMRCHIMNGNLEDARQIADALPIQLQTESNISGAISMLELAEQGGNADEALVGLEERMEHNPDDLQGWIDLAMARYGANDKEGAVDALLESIRRDRTFDDEAARKQLLKFFEAFGHTDPVTVSARRRLSSILFPKRKGRNQCRFSMTSYPTFCRSFR